MFTDNWFLFLLVIMLVFSADGDISRTETAVMIAILMALTVSCCPNAEDADDGCFCNRGTTNT